MADTSQNHVLCRSIRFPENNARLARMDVQRERLCGSQCTPARVRRVTARRIRRLIWFAARFGLYDIVAARPARVTVVQGIRYCCVALAQKLADLLAISRHTALIGIEVDRRGDIYKDLAHNVGPDRSGFSVDGAVQSDYLLQNMSVEAGGIILLLLTPLRAHGLRGSRVKGSSPRARNSASIASMSEAGPLSIISI